MNDDAADGRNTGILVIGYGNPLRTDDGLGWHVAIRLSRDPRLAGVEVLPCFQLTPGLAVDLSYASLVALIDARRDRRAAGTIAVRRIDPALRRRPPSSASGTPPTVPAAAVRLASSC
jgi:hydrogenase maturation protease